MLTKDFQRVFIPGRPGSPEVPGRPETTVCYDPPQGEWVQKVSTVYFDPSESTRMQLPGSVSGPFGPVVLTADYYNPYTGTTYRAGTSVMYVLVTYSEWVPYSNPGDPICTTYPAVEYQPAVPAVPARWETRPNIGWDAGANSVQTHSGDCEAKWTMGMVVGAHIGLTDDREDVTSPERLSHAFYFHQRAGVPQFRVVESGSARSSDRPYTPGDEFAIRRARGVVSYWYNGEKLQDSFETSEGEVSVGCAIYMSGDVLPGGAGGPTPPPDPDPDPDPGEGLRFTGTVPPNYESAPFFLAAGDYVATESAAGASCDWFIRDVDSMQEVFEYAVEGGTVHFSMAQGANCVLVVEAYQTGGPFDITIGPDSGGGDA